MLHEQTKLSRRQSIQNDRTCYAHDYKIIQIQNSIAIWNANLLVHRILELKTFVHYIGDDVMLIAETVVC